MATQLTFSDAAYDLMMNEIKSLPLAPCNSCGIVKIVVDETMMVSGYDDIICNNCAKIALHFASIYHSLKATYRLESF